MSQRSLVVMRIHSPEKCAERPCAWHNPSDHHMRDWPKHFRADRYLTERLCPHGIGHPDPDDQAYLESIGRADGVHGCDGCCFTPKVGKSA